MAMSERRYEAVVRAAELGRQARTETAQERYERFVELRRRGCTIQVAAWDLRISWRQAARYAARYRDESEQVAA